MKYFVFTTLLVILSAFSAIGQAERPSETTPTKGDKTAKANKGEKGKTKKKPCPDLPKSTTAIPNGWWGITSWSSYKKSRDSEDGFLNDTDSSPLYREEGEENIFDPNEVETGGINEEGMRNFLTRAIYGYDPETREAANKVKPSRMVVTIQYKADNGETWNVQYEVTEMKDAPPKGPAMMLVECISANKM